MPMYRSKPREIEAVEFDDRKLLPHMVRVRSVEDGYQLWNELHQTWINIKRGVMLNITNPNDVYPIVDFDDLYELVETK